MLENIILSVITINYNNALGLKKTIDSVVNQNWDEFEYLVIDGGSTDESEKIIQSYEGKIDYWVSEKDNGIYAAMNKGILKSKGKYLLFLNSGDFLVDRDVFKNAINAFYFTADFVCGHLSFQKGKNRIIKEHPSQMTFSYLVSKTVCHPSTFIKKELFEKHGLYNEDNKIVSDWEFFFKTMGLNGATYQKLGVIITHYDLSGISSISADKVRQEKQDVFRKYLPYVFNNENDCYIFDKFRETNRRFKLLKEIDKSPFFRKIASFQLLTLRFLVRMFNRIKVNFCKG